jgi:hypothetical protein
MKSDNASRQNVIARSEATSLTRSLKLLHFLASSTVGYTDFSGVLSFPLRLDVARDLGR